jgi:hypothetical protein
MLTETLRSVLDHHVDDIALVVGNGINLFGRPSGPNSWEALLLEISRGYIETNGASLEGMSLTEFYDIIALKADPHLREKSDPSQLRTSLQKRFCELMQSWQPQTQHYAVVEWAQRHQCPILTTNFEKTLSAAGACRKFTTTTEHFTSYYPWEVYFAQKSVAFPETGFGVWHINGLNDYTRSIRLGLSHYMGSVHRARAWLHGARERRLFDGKNEPIWRGRQTWLHIAFAKSLVFIGLGLHENEMFLRWLLIERARYFGAFPKRAKKAWFFHVSAEKPGKLLFLQGVGVTPIQLEDHAQIWSKPVWR